MSRFKCPHCDARFRVDQSNAGDVGISPTCKARFRIPVRPDENHREAEPSRQTQAFDKKKGTIAHEVRSPNYDVDGGETLPTAPRATRKRRKKRRRMFSKVLLNIDPFIVIICGLVVLGMIQLVIALMWPTGSLLMRGSGCLIAMVGGVWFARAAFQDSAETGFLCFFIPFYGLDYLINNFGELKRPLLLQLIGLVFVLLGEAIEADLY